MKSTITHDQKIRLAVWKKVIKGLRKFSEKAMKHGWVKKGDDGFWDERELEASLLEHAGIWEDIGLKL